MLTGSGVGTEEIRELVEFVPPDLVSLDLSIEETSVTSEFFSLLSTLPQPRRLVLQRCTVRLHDFADLKSRSLRVLSLLDVDLHQAGAGSLDLSGLSHLTTFQFTSPSGSPHSQIGNKLLQQIGLSLKHLPPLTLTRISVTDTGFSASAPLPDLLNLELDDTSISDAGLSAIAGDYPKLESLKLSRKSISQDSRISRTMRWRCWASWEAR